jgi:DNA-directed RNA polymerase specialized sigma24 family protein
MTETAAKLASHTVDEFRAALNLDVAGWARLRSLARNRCRIRCPDQEDDVLQEAITRTLAGTRKWPKNVNLHAFLSGVMKSIVSEAPGIGFRKNIDKEIDPDLPVKDVSPDAAAIYFEGEVELHLMALFEDDDDAKMIVEGRLEGMDREDFLDVFDQDKTRYETACKRVRRKLNQHGCIREMIHG